MYCVGRTMWVQKIKAASEHFIETEKKKREKAYQGKQCVCVIFYSKHHLHTVLQMSHLCVFPARSLKSSGIGRLLVTVTEAQELKACKPNGENTEPAATRLSHQTFHTLTRHMQPPSR